MHIVFALPSSFPWPEDWADFVPMVTVQGPERRQDCRFPAHRLLSKGLSGVYAWAERSSFAWIDLNLSWEMGMPYAWEKPHSRSVQFRGFAGAAFLFALAAASNASAAPVTLRCTLGQAESRDAIVQYYAVDSDRKTISNSGDIYRLGEDPNGHSGRVITNWSDTEITLISEEWIRNGWQQFRIVTVLDRLTGAIRSEDLNSSYSGSCTIANVSKKIF